MKRLVLYGLSGSGKSTSAGIVKKYFEGEGRTVDVIKLSEPLYELQSQFYTVAGKTMEYYQQDQPLLELIAERLRLISSSSLVDYFINRLHASRADIVINDDLRDPFVDYPLMKEHNFIFILIQCPENLRIARLLSRSDQAVVIHSKTTAHIEMIKPDYVIWNEEPGLDHLKRSITSILEEIA